MMKLEETKVNVLFLPVLNDLLPKGVGILHLSCKEKTLEFDIKGVGNGDVEVTRRYWAHLEEFRFDEAGRYATFSYGDTISPDGMDVQDGIGIRDWLRNNKEIHVSEDRITIQLSQLVLEHPSLKKVTVNGIEIHEGYLSLEMDPPSVSFRAEENQQEGKQGELILIELNPEQQRFYDSLRKKIETFIRDKMGDSQSEKIIPYLLLAPDIFVLLVRLLKDNRVSVKSKAIVMVAILYFMTPFDIIPEVFFGPMGYIDDLVLAVMALNKIIGEVDESILREHWNGKENLLHVIQDVIEKADELVGTKRMDKIRSYLKKKAR